MPGDDELKEYNQGLIAAFRANGSRAPEGEDSHLLLLTTVGAKSGRPHTAPLAYMNDGDRFIVFAAHAGEPSRPAWYYNLVAHPDVTVELGGESWQTRAVVATGTEREHLYKLRAEEAPFIVDLQNQIPRPMPVIILERPAPGASQAAQQS